MVTLAAWVLSMAYHLKPNVYIEMMDVTSASGVPAAGLIYTLTTTLPHWSARTLRRCSIAIFVCWSVHACSMITHYSINRQLAFCFGMGPLIGLPLWLRWAFRDAKHGGGRDHPYRFGIIQVRRWRKKKN